MDNVILSLGSSLGDRKKIIDSALQDIEDSIGSVVSVSNFYESEPWGFNDSNFFYNIAVNIKTSLAPSELLSRIQELEKKYERVKTKDEYEARTLDIDIIFFGNKIVNNDNLQIPHKFAHERKFVLLPVAEVVCNFEHPVLKKTINELLKVCKDNSLISLVNNN